MTPVVYLTCPLPESRTAPLANHCQLHSDEAGAYLTARSAPAILADCRGLICLLTDRVDRALLQKMPALEFVSSVSVGVDHVDVAALTERGIPLGHTPGVLVDATADTAFALLLAAARRVPESDRFIREGNWRPERRWSPDFFLGRDLAGATLGILGMGAIGRAVARRAAGFGMQVIGCNRTPRDVDGIASVSMDELLGRSDYLSVHVALTDDTRDLLDATRIALMKPGAVLINTARGGIVDEAALAAALDSGHLWAAGVDVFANEPLEAQSPLLANPKVVLTPHIGSATSATRGAMVDLAIANAVAALQGQRMPHCVNPQVYD